MRFILLLLVFCWFAPGAQSQGVDPDAGAIRRDLAALTSDEFRGRGTGDVGYTRAAQYVADQLFALGFHSFNTDLRPAAKAEDFFHQVPLIKEQLISVSLKTGQKSWKYGKDFYTNRTFPTEVLQSDSILYIEADKLEGVTAARLQNKVLVVWRKKAENGKRATSVREISRNLSRFAPKAIVVADAEFPAKPAQITAAMAEENIRIDYSKERGDGSSSTAGRAVPMFIVSEKVAAKMWKSAGLNWQKSWLLAEAERGKKIIASAFSLNAKANVVNTPFEAPNVAGFLPGKKAQEEYIVVSAHLDHLGMHDGKTFYGADDNGSGSSALLEMSRMLFAYREQGLMPDKTIVFLWFTGEEHGLLGSQYFTSFPPVDIESFKVNLNVDMIGRVDKAHQKDTNYVYLIGSDRLSSDLHRKSEEVNTNCCAINLDYTFNEPNDPNRFYQRSDHYNFAKYGIPVIFYFSGVHEDYHKATDTADKINYERIARITNLIFQTAVGLGNMEEPLLIDKQ